MPTYEIPDRDHPSRLLRLTCTEDGSVTLERLGACATVQRITLTAARVAGGLGLPALGGP